MRVVQLEAARRPRAAHPRRQAGAAVGRKPRTVLAVFGAGAGKGGHSMRAVEVLIVLIVLGLFIAVLAVGIDAVPGGG